MADNQYSALGLVLIGALARVKSVLTAILGEEDEEGVEMGDENPELKMNVNVDCPVDTGVLEPVERGEAADHGDDLGEVISREKVDEFVLGKTAEGAGELNNSTKGRPKKRKEKERGNAGIGESTPLKPPKKKRKKGGDAFDDLFSSLL